MSFDTALKFVLEAEGGYSNACHDKGGATQCGITQKTLDGWRRTHRLPLMPVSRLTAADIATIYREMYWLAAHCDALPDKLATVHFDTAVNCGPGNAARMLQRAVGAEPDGAVGPETLALAKDAVEAQAVDDYLSIRHDYYHDLVDRDPSQGVFLQGWLNRLTHLEDYLK